MIHGYAPRLTPCACVSPLTDPGHDVCVVRLPDRVDADEETWHRVGVGGAGDVARKVHLRDGQDGAAGHPRVHQGQW